MNVVTRMAAAPNSVPTSTVVSIVPVEMATYSVMTNTPVSVSSFHTYIYRKT